MSKMIKNICRLIVIFVIIFSVLPFILNAREFEHEWHLKSPRQEIEPSFAVETRH